MINRHEAAALYGCLSVLATGWFAAPAFAQQPSPDQISAIRSHCRSDFMSRCSGVTPGGADALACLRKNAAQLAPACQAAVNATAPKPAPAPAAAAAPPPVHPGPPPAVAAATAAPPPSSPAPVAAAPASAPPAAAATPPAMNVPSADQVAAIRASCPADSTSHCAGVPPGGAEALACLRRNAAQLSPPCRFAVGSTGAPPAAAPAQRTAVAAPAATPRPAAPPQRAAAPAPAPAAAATAKPRPPTAEQQAAIRASCRNDFMSRCAGVQPGGADALACLQRNASALSPGCKTAVAAIGTPGAAAAAPTAAAAPAAPTAAQQNAIKMTCRRDFMMNCRGVQPGGPEAFVCLQRNASRLSPDCRTSLAAINDPGVAAATPAATAAAPAAKPMGGPFPLRRAIRERMMGN